MIPCFAKLKGSTPFLRQNVPLSDAKLLSTCLLPPRRLPGRVQAGDFQTPPPDGEEGNEKVQDALINMLKFQIGKKKVRGIVGYTRNASVMKST